jgi:hypothetical protein
MRSRLVRAGGSSEISFPLESVRRVPQKGNVKSFVIALLLVVSDEPAESKHVVTTSTK